MRACIDGATDRLATLVVQVPKVDGPHASIAQGDPATVTGTGNSGITGWQVNWGDGTKDFAQGNSGTFTRDDLLPGKCRVSATAEDSAGWHAAALDARLTSSGYRCFSSGPAGAGSLLEAGQMGVTSVMAGEDDAIALVSLETQESQETHCFTFYGAQYDELCISTNGLITFGQGDASAANGPLDSSLSAPAIAVLWDDWETTGQGSAILYKFADLDGSDGIIDHLVVQWTNVNHVGGTNSATFQAVLALDTDDVPGGVAFRYLDLDTGDSYSLGA